METVFVVVPAIFCVLFSIFLYKQQEVKSKTIKIIEAENTSLLIRLAKAEEGLLYYKAESTRYEEKLRELREKYQAELQAHEGLKSFYKAGQQKFEEQKHETEKLRQSFKTEFENIAGQILKEKTKEFTEVNRLNLDVLLNPLKENIKAFESKVERVYKAESDERNILKGEIAKLMELNKQISDEAHNLTRALKTDTKKQGNWGEIVLDKVLEASGLILGESYIKQSSFTGEEGNRLQPDIVVVLPDKKHLIIDAKVSLIAYERFVNCESDDDKTRHLKDHLLSVRNHITGLSNKNYQDLYKINSPDFVLLFFPIESSFSIAVQTDPELFNYAWNKRVVIVTPSTLLATLKTIGSIWKQEQQTRNAIDIATKAGALYDKFVGFITDLNKVGDHLDKAKLSYSEAFGKLSSGSGNIIGRVEILRKLGAKTGKQLDERLVEEES